MTKGADIIWKNITILEDVDKIMAVESEDVTRLEVKICNLEKEILSLKEKCQLPITADNYNFINNKGKLIHEMENMLDFLLRYKQIKSKFKTNL